MCRFGGTDLLVFSHNIAVCMLVAAVTGNNNVQKAHSHSMTALEAAALLARAEHAIRACTRFAGGARAS